MKEEGEVMDEIEAGRFRDQFFLHSIASQNPKLYFELYEEPEVPEEWEVPETVEDLQRMIAELSQIGVDLDAPEEIPPYQPDQAALEAQYGVRSPQQHYHRS